MEKANNIYFCNKRTLAERTGYSTHTLKKLRQRGDWIEGIHYIRQNSRVVRYNLNLCLDWLANRQNPQFHQRAIEDYLSSLPSNQPQKRGRRAV